MSASSVAIILGISTAIFGISTAVLWAIASRLNDYCSVLRSDVASLEEDCEALNLQRSELNRLLDKEKSTSKSTKGALESCKEIIEQLSEQSAAQNTHMKQHEKVLAEIAALASGSKQIVPSWLEEVTEMRCQDAVKLASGSNSH